MDFDGIDRFKESEEWQSMMNGEYNELLIDGLIGEARRRSIMIDDMIKSLRKDAADINMKMLGIRISIANADAESLPPLLDEICALAVKKFKCDTIADAVKRHAACLNEIEDVLDEVKEEEKDGNIKGGIFGVISKANEVIERRKKKRDGDSIENN